MSRAASSPLVLLLALAACGRGGADATDPTDTLVDTDPDTAWAPPPAGPFQFQTETTYRGEPWTVDAHYFPASKPGRPAVLFTPGGPDYQFPEKCGINDWPDGMVEPFVDRDWAVLVSDRVGCKTTHELHFRPIELKEHHTSDDLMMQLGRKLRADGYGPLTVIGDTRLYWVRARDPGEVQMKAGITPWLGFPSGEPMSKSLPFKWLIVSPYADEQTLLARRPQTWEFNGGPYPEWDIRYGWPDPNTFKSRTEERPTIWEEYAAWLEPHLEGAYEAGPDAWETP